MRIKLLLIFILKLKFRIVIVSCIAAISMVLGMKQLLVRHLVLETAASSLSSECCSSRTLEISSFYIVATESLSLIIMFCAHAHAFSNITRLILTFDP